MHTTSAVSVVMAVFLSANCILSLRKAYQEWQTIRSQMQSTIPVRQLALWKWVVIWFALAVGFFSLLLIKIFQHFETIHLSTLFLVLWGLFIAINVFVHLCDVYRHRQDTRNAYVFGVIAVSFFAIFLLTVIVRRL